MKGGDEKKNVDILGVRETHPTTTTTTTGELSVSCDTVNLPSIGCKPSRQSPS